MVMQTYFIQLRRILSLMMYSYMVSTTWKL